MQAAGCRVVLAITVAALANAQGGLCKRDLSASLEKEAFAAMSARDYQLAAQRFSEAFDASPKNRSNQLALAQAQVSGRKFDAAIRTAERYLATDPASVPGHVILANAYLMAQRTKDALAA